MACQRCGIAEGGTSRQSLQRRGRLPKTLGLESIRAQNVYVKWICCASGVDLMRSICSQATLTASSCRLLSRMVLEPDPREVWIYYRMWQQGRRKWRDPSCCLWPVGSWPGATLRQERVAPFGTSSGQWKPSSSPFISLALHAVAPVTLSLFLAAPHVVVTARVGALFVGIEQLAGHVDRAQVGLVQQHSPCHRISMPRKRWKGRSPLPASVRCHGERPGGGRLRTHPEAFGKAKAEG